MAATARSISSFDCSVSGRGVLRAPPTQQRCRLRWHARQAEVLVHCVPVASAEGVREPDKCVLRADPVGKCQVSLAKPAWLTAAVNRAGLSKEQVLKVPASMNMTAGLYTYLLQHTRESEVRSTGHGLIPAMRALSSMCRFPRTTWAGTPAKEGFYYLCSHPTRLRCSCQASATSRPCCWL